MIPNPITTSFDPRLYTNMPTTDFHRQEIVPYKTPLSKQGVYLNKLKKELIKALGSDCRMCWNPKIKEVSYYLH